MDHDLEQLVSGVSQAALACEKLFVKVATAPDLHLLARWLYAVKQTLAAVQFTVEGVREEWTRQNPQ